MDVFFYKDKKPDCKKGFESMLIITKKRKDLFFDPCREKFYFSEALKNKHERT